MDNRICYLLATQYDNLGDLLINKCLVDELSQYGPVFVDSKNSSKEFISILLQNENVRQLSAISSISLKGSGMFLAALNPSFKFSHLFKSPGPFGGALSKVDRAKYLLFVLLFRIMKNKGCRSYLLGVDLIVKNHFDNRLQKMFSKTLEGMYVRSKKNVGVLKNLDIENASYIPDMCFLLADKVDTNGDKKSVGISFRDLDDPALNENIFQAVAHYIQYSSEKGLSIRFFFQVERDHAFNKELFERFKHLGDVAFEEQVLKWKDIDIYKQFFSVLSNRLHVLLLGQMFETIPLGLINESVKTSKIGNIYNSVGLEEMIKPSFSRVDISSLLDDSEHLRLKIRSVNKEQLSIAKQTIKSIFTK